jgi:hypothetical protein
MNKPATRKRDALNHPFLHLSDTDLALLLNLDNHLRRLQFLATHNPLYYWLAIDLCITAKRQFPDWIRDYLGKCAHNWILAGKEEQDRKAKQARRLAKAKQKAKRAPDIREKVLEILGFPKNKFGPGSLLDPNYGASRRMPAALDLHEFGGELPVTPIEVVVDGFSLCFEAESALALPIRGNAEIGHPISIGRSWIVSPLWAGGGRAPGQCPLYPIECDAN